MRLGDIETHLEAALHAVVGNMATIWRGPPIIRTSTGLKPELFIHATRFLDMGGAGQDGGRITRRPLTVGRGYAEERPVHIDVEITCISPAYELLLDMCAVTTPPVLTALQTLPPPLLAGLPETGVELRFADFVAAPQSSETYYREMPNGAWYEGKLVFRLDGFLHIRLARPDGSAIRLSVVYNPTGVDLAGEHVLLTNGSRLPLPLTGHILQDDARRSPHRYIFPPFSLAPGASVQVWTGRGKDNAGNLYWGRRQAVWNNGGDTLRLLDPKGVEVACLSYTAPTSSPVGTPKSPPRSTRKNKT